MSGTCALRAVDKERLAALVISLLVQLMNHIRFHVRHSVRGAAPMYPPTSSATVRYTHHGGAPATPSYTPHDHSLRSARPVLTRIGAGLALLAAVGAFALRAGAQSVPHLMETPRNG